MPFGISSIPTIHHYLFSTTWRVLVPDRELVPATAQQPTIPVKTLTLQSRIIQERSEFIANVRSRRSVTLRPRIQGQITQRPRIQGQITQILVTPGERVTTGTVLIQIDPDEQQAAVSSTSAAVESAQANVDNARAILGGRRDTCKMGHVVKFC